MKRSLLLIISGDPRRSPRPAEAVRIAAGILPWGQVRLQVCLRDEAVLALDPRSEDWDSGDAFVRHLPAIAQHANSVWVQNDSPFLAGLADPIVPFEPVNAAQLARKAGESDCVMRF
jgi:hypothetical protein